MAEYNLYDVEYCRQALKEIKSFERTVKLKAEHYSKWKSYENSSWRK